MFAVSCVLCVGAETAFDEYLQRDCSHIKSGNLARCVILSPALWEFFSLIGGVGGILGVYQGGEHQVCSVKCFKAI